MCSCTLQHHNYKLERELFSLPSFGWFSGGGRTGEKKSFHLANCITLLLWPNRGFGSVQGTFELLLQLYHNSESIKEGGTQFGECCGLQVLKQICLYVNFKSGQE